MVQALERAELTSVPVVSNMLAGKLVRLVQPYQVNPKLVPLEVFNNGKLVRLVQLYQVAKKLVPLEVFNNGKLVRLVQLAQTRPKFVTELDTSNAHTNEVMLLAPCQALSKIVPKSAPLPIATEVI